MDTFVDRGIPTLDYIRSSVLIGLGKVKMRFINLAINDKMVRQV